MATEIFKFTNTFYLPKNEEWYFLEELYPIIQSEVITCFCCYSGLIKFFGNVGAVRPWQLVEKYGSVLALVLSLAAGSLDLGDPTLQSVAIQTVAHIGSSHDGKLALSKCSKYCGIIKHH